MPFDIMFKGNLVDVSMKCNLPVYITIFRNC